MSALPPIADIHRYSWNVRKVPLADVRYRLSNRLSRQRTRDKEQETNFTAPCKSVLAAVAAPDDPSRIERGSVRGFLLAKISESGFLSSRRRSNIIRRATATGRPSPLARRNHTRIVRFRGVDIRKHRIRLCAILLWLREDMRAQWPDSMICRQLVIVDPPHAG